ncbi:MAG: phage holin family protein [Desulfovibrionaceae bacterium]|nr:phage holin family protein [Desulfovibrionaceae bacterium]
MSEVQQFKWHCQRMGGTDQVMLSTMAELRHLRELDPKLWGALSCPASGLEFDATTLKLLDTDCDGRIRMPEILDATDWICARVNDTADIPSEPTSVPLSAIDDTRDEGKRLKTTATTILKTLEITGEDARITPEQVKQAAENAAGQSFNGDGILPPLEEMDDSLREFVEKGLAVVGGAQDAGGSPGLNAELADAFVHELTAWKEWRANVAKTEHPVEKTEEAWNLLQELRPKIDDFFLRCGLSSFAPQATAHLNAEVRLKEAADKEDIALDDLITMPLARIENGARLPLSEGLNPVWSDRIHAFADLVRPLLTDEEYISPKDWRSIEKAFAAFGDALGKRPSVATYEAGSFAQPVDPNAALDALGEEGVDRLLNPKLHAEFKQLCERDLANAAASEDIAELEKFVLYYCNIHRLLMNFVSFYDFYTLRPNVTFRAGTLYIDGRSCQLCVPVDDVGKHSTMAGMSQLCLLYCECTRYGEDGSVQATRNIMAVLTAGTDDVLIEGRNGVFVDNTGKDWDARLVKIIHNPISFKQAIWSPYKRISTMVGEAVAKFAASKRDESLSAAQKGIANITAPKPAQAAAPFDISKGVGIFAAVGIALGAIGTAIGSIAQALFSLAWWQFPLLIAGIFLIISGPSVFLAWLKFRKRTFGPVLEASGWAVNTLLPINIKLGGALTSVAKQPDNIERQSILDPFREDKKPRTGLWITVIILASALIFGGWLWGTGKLDGIIKKVTAIVQPDKTDEKKKDDKKQSDKKKDDKKQDDKKQDDKKQDSKEPDKPADTKQEKK